MTIWGILAALRRRIALTCLGLVVAALASVPIHQIRGVYLAQVDVVLLPPINRYTPNNLAGTSSSLIATAGVLQRQVMAHGGGDAAVVSPAVNLAQEGVRAGERVVLPDFGGQWAHDYRRAALDVQVVADDRDDAVDRMARVLERIQTALDRLQTRSGVNPDERIVLRLSPSQVHVQYLGGRPRVAALSTFLLGLAATIALVTYLEGRENRRSFGVAFRGQPEVAAIRTDSE